MKKNDNDILDVDVDLENNIEEENYLNNQENDENNNFVGNNYMNYNKERYKFIYEEGKKQNNFNNNISINNPFLGIK